MPYLCFQQSRAGIEEGGETRVIWAKNSLLDLHSPRQETVRLF